MSYNPVKIKNPSAMRHLCRIMPGQSIELTTPEAVFINGQFLKAKSIGNDKFIIEAIDDIIELASISNQFLGQILIGDKKTIIVILEDSECVQKEVVSVRFDPEITPLITYAVRLKENNILEVIILSEDQYMPSWSWEGVRLNSFLCFVSYVNTSHNKSDNLYLISPKLDKKNLIAHHFWFSINKSSTLNVERGVYFGRLQVETTLNESHYLEIYCDIEEKTTTRKTKNSLIVQQDYDNLVDRRQKQKVKQPNLLKQFQISKSRKVLHNKVKVDIVKLDTRSMKFGCQTINYIF